MKRRYLIVAGRKPDGPLTVRRFTKWGAYRAVQRIERLGIAWTVRRD